MIELLAARLKGAHSKPAHPNELDAFEREHGVVLPGDLREFLQKVGGGVDNDMFAFTPLSGLKPLPEAPGHFHVADFMIDAWYYGIHLGPEAGRNAVLLLTGTPDEPRKVAVSFTQFAELYLADSPTLYPPEAE